MDYKELSTDEKTWGAFCHLAGFLCIVFPFGNFIGTTGLWLLKRKESDFIN